MKLPSLSILTGLMALVIMMSTVKAAPSATPADSKTLGSVTAIDSLDVPKYMGTWYQVAWFPNRFQKQCVSDTTATYRQLPGGTVEVLNRCKSADGKFDDVLGLARPAGSRLEGQLLKPAKLEVSFLPAALRWLPIWGDYWVLNLADDGRYAVIGESSRKYLWVLSRTPTLSTADEIAIRSLLKPLGFDLSRWQAHTHTGPGR